MFLSFLISQVEPEMAEFEVEEIRLDMKYGQIAGKWWGSKDKRPILMVHGKLLQLIDII